VKSINRNQLKRCNDASQAQASKVTTTRQRPKRLKVRFMVGTPDKCYGSFYGDDGLSIGDDYGKNEVHSENSR